LVLGLILSRFEPGDASAQPSTAATLPPEIRQQLERQKAALSTVYLEFTTTNRGSDAFLANSKTRFC
jgi:hypothetical protein